MVVAEGVKAVLEEEDWNGQEGCKTEAVAEKVAFFSHVEPKLN